MCWNYTISRQSCHHNEIRNIDDDRNIGNVRKLSGTTGVLIQTLADESQRKENCYSDHYKKETRFNIISSHLKHVLVQNR